MPIDTNKFSGDFRDHPNFKKIVAEINRSPYLVDLINRFNGRIDLGRPETGYYYSHSDNKISFDSDMVDEISTSSDPDYLSEFVTALGHELGHAVVPGGTRQTNAQMTLQQYVDARLKQEGVAVLTAYQVATELGKPMWAGRNLQDQLDIALAVKIIDREMKDDEAARKVANKNIQEIEGFAENIIRNNPELAKEIIKNDKGFVEKAIAIGAEDYRRSRPASTPRLTYEQKLSAWYVLNHGQHDYSKGEIERIDWYNLKPEDVAIRQNADSGKWEFVNRLPLKPTPAEQLASSAKSVADAAAKGVEPALKSAAEGMKNLKEWVHGASPEANTNNVNGITMEGLRNPAYKTKTDFTDLSAKIDYADAMTVNMGKPPKAGTNPSPVASSQAVTKKQANAQPRVNQSSNSKPTQPTSPIHPFAVAMQARLDEPIPLKAKQTQARTSTQISKPTQPTSSIHPRAAQLAKSGGVSPLNTPGSKTTQTPQISGGITRQQSARPNEVAFDIKVNPLATEGTQLKARFYGSPDKLAHYMVDSGKKSADGQPIYSPLKSGSDIDVPVAKGATSAQVRVINNGDPTKPPQIDGIVASRSDPNTKQVAADSLRLGTADTNQKETKATPALSPQQEAPRQSQEQQQKAPKSTTECGRPSPG